ncbi:MAG: M48 family metallopeptidase [Aestuariivirga sp.]|uniref:M48 family metalloprotease n=1 Tax=Aestuariivirga sp. TaxID=2650926 RepID=UPI0025BC2CDC|nr:M48 family metalloprotease [Aestuariivirga sp.]MCA3561029.1 M48 family metallopeptidase [Aestuariivirga sp.]
MLRTASFFCATARLMAALMACMSVALPQAEAAQRGKPLPIIRDAEIEGLMRLYTRPIFKAAGINPRAVKVYILNDRSINAFVAGGQRIFINTGLIERADTPNEVIGVLAHETGHIAGGHLARMGVEIDSANYTQIAGMLLGLAAIAGGVASGNGEIAQAGQGIMAGTQGLAQRNFLTYARGMEASADQAALKFLNETRQSARGMVTLFETLARENIATLADVDPYVMSHPMPMDRIRNFEVEAKKSPYWDAKDPPALMLRHQLVQAKLAGYIGGAQAVMQKYPSTDQSMPARYARAIAMFRRGDIQNALPIIDGLIKELPENPYFWELKAQALLENGRAAEAAVPVRKALELLPSNGLILILAAQTYIDTGKPDNAGEAIKLLRQAQRTEGETPETFRLLARAYALTGDVPRAELATAQAALLMGDTKLALEKARSAQAAFKTGTPEWTRASDVISFAGR